MTDGEKARNDFLREMVAVREAAAGGGEMNCVYLFERAEHGECPAGITISRTRKLPKGNFRITEYSWGGRSLWFVDKHKFTADEREKVFRFMMGVP